MAADCCPDVSVLDQEMPAVTGLQALPQLRRLCPTSRIVMWSSDLTVRNTALAAGVDAFIDKGAGVDVLLAALTTASADRRSAARAMLIPDSDYLVFVLPSHRIVAGAVIAYVASDGVARRLVLPGEVIAGRPVRSRRRPPSTPASRQLTNAKRAGLACWRDRPLLLSG